MNTEVRCFITGDIHRHDYSRFDAFDYIIDDLQKTTNYVIVLGDFGLNYYNNISDNIAKDFYNKIANKYNFTFIAIRGNHELRPEKLDKYEPIYKNEDGLNGFFLIEKDYPKLLFCYSFGDFMINSKRFYQIGGAYSVDKEYRLMTGAMWTPDEQLTKDEKKTVEIEITCRSYNYILSHTCPLKWEPSHLFISAVNQDKVDKSTEEWMDKIEPMIKYDKWYFGHYHSDEVISEKAELIFHDIKEIEV